MKNGLYEVPILKSIDSDKHIKKERIELSEILRILSKDCEVFLRKKLETLKKKDVFSFYQNLYQLLKEDEAENPDLLLVVYEDKTLIRELIENRPLTSIAFSSLLLVKRLI